MKIEVNIEKKYFFGLIALGLIVLGIVGVIAYGTSNPEVFGHTVEEINWDEDVPKLCLGGTCITSWAGLSGSSAGSENFSVAGTISADKGVIIGKNAKIVWVNASISSCSGVILAVKSSVSKTCGSSGTCTPSVVSITTTTGSPVPTSCTTPPASGGWRTSVPSCTYYTSSTTITSAGPFGIPPAVTTTTCNSVTCNSDATEYLCVADA